MHYGYPKIGVFGGFRAKTYNLRSTTLHRNTSFDVFRVKIGSAVRAVPEFMNRKKEKKRKYLGPIFTKIWVSQLANDVITANKFDR